MTLLKRMRQSTGRDQNRTGKVLIQWTTGKLFSFCEGTLTIEGWDTCWKQDGATEIELDVVQEREREKNIRGLKRIISLAFWVANFCLVDGHMAAAGWWDHVKSDGSRANYTWTTGTPHSFSFFSRFQLSLPWFLIFDHGF